MSAFWSLLEPRAARFAGRYSPYRCPFPGTSRAFGNIRPGECGFRPAGSLQGLREHGRFEAPRAGARQQGSGLPRRPCAAGRAEFMMSDAQVARAMGGKGHPVEPGRLCRAEDGNPAPSGRDGKACCAALRRRFSPSGWADGGSRAYA